MQDFEITAYAQTGQSVCSVCVCLCIISQSILFYLYICVCVATPTRALMKKEKKTNTFDLLNTLHVGCVHEEANGSVRA